MLTLTELDSRRVAYWQKNPESRSRLTTPYQPHNLFKLIRGPAGSEGAGGMDVPRELRIEPPVSIAWLAVQSKGVVPPAGVTCTSTQKTLPVLFSITVADSHYFTASAERCNCSPVNICTMRVAPILPRPNSNDRGKAARPDAGNGGGEPAEANELAPRVALELHPVSPVSPVSFGACSASDEQLRIFRK
jgi:hypothetical protein